MNCKSQWRQSDAESRQSCRGIQPANRSRLDWINVAPADATRQHQAARGRKRKRSQTHLHGGVLNPEESGKRCIDVPAVSGW